MKTVIVAFGVLIVLATVWTLFLEHEKRRFVESLPKPPTTVTQPVNTADMSAASETGESVDAAGSLPDASAVVEETPDAVEHAPLHPHPHVDSLVLSEEAEVSFEELPAADETPPDSDTKDSFPEPAAASQLHFSKMSPNQQADFLRDSWIEMFGDIPEVHTAAEYMRKVLLKETDDG